MKSKHRHELKSNELAQWLADFPAWLKENMRTVIIVAVIILAVIASYLWKQYQQNVILVQEKSNFTNTVAQIPRIKMTVLQAQAQDAPVDNSVLLLEAGEQLKTIAAQTTLEDMSALAYIKQAELIRAELHFRMEMPTPAEIAGQVAKAKESYTQALAKAEDNPQLAAKAQFGLGLCEEELRNFDKAKQIYNQILQTEPYKPTVAYEQAQRRLEVMDDYRTIATFKPAPPLEAAPEPQLGGPLELLPDFQTEPYPLEPQQNQQSQIPQASTDDQDSNQPTP